ncbi:MAG: YcaQ family DNA glycosylase [Betaproteobacteria bacterium]|nr:YcaQ family DNA glycosylase [Betaproteobacteria bacterium]
MTSTRPVTLARLRGYAIARSLFTPTTLPAAFRRMGYVQADPIRAPSRAQDLILRHRVKGYHDGDLERRYPRLRIEEDALHNYGFLDRELQALLHPRAFSQPLRIERAHPQLIQPVLDFVRANGPTHPRDLDPQHGGKSVANYWGGSSSAATQVLDILHYRGALRVTRRVNGVRVYAVATHHAPDAMGLAGEERVQRLIARLVDLYAPVPEASLRQLTMLLRYGAPHLETALRDRAMVNAAIDAGMLRECRVDGANWIVPAAETVRGAAPDAVRLLAPFDPVVWDRRRFELFWGWRYRFEAYTPPAKRRLGYYALPLLWRDQVAGWANVKSDGARLVAEIGFAQARPREAAFKRELDAELERMRDFLGATRIGRIAYCH